MIQQTNGVLYCFKLKNARYVACKKIKQTLLHNENYFSITLKQTVRVCEGGAVRVSD